MIGKCGHVVEAVIAHYYACPTCDYPSVAEPVAKSPARLCPHCGSEEVVCYPGMSLMGNDLWECEDCGGKHVDLSAPNKPGKP
jgi:ribosomal protein L37AE/L43A